MEAMSLPGVWPLEGTVKQAYQHYYASSENWAYPPPGFLQEISYFGKLSMDMVGKLERDNLDTFFLAWLLKLEEVEGNPQDLQKMKDHAKAVPTHFNKRSSEDNKLQAAYQNKEHEEKNADILGHSLLSRARELVGLQDPDVTRAR